MKRITLLCLTWAAIAGCADIHVAPPDESELEVWEQRFVELRYLRFDVSNYEQRISREDILAFPQDLLDRMWLLDLELAGAPNSPRILDNALKAVRTIDPESLGQAERNLQRLLEMTPDNADLEGTPLEQLVGLAPLLGLAPERVMADLFDIGVQDTFLSEEIMARAILELAIETHPNQRTRLGPRTPGNPEGVYAVAPGSLAITLEDLVTSFESFAVRYGPYDENGERHPGFIGEGIRADVIDGDFALVVRVNANALPYKGLDLNNTHVASVSSAASQVDNLFDFDDPNWMKVEGLVEGEPTIDELTMRIAENDAFIASGRSPLPEGFGSSPAWELPAWSFEYMLIQAGQWAFGGLDSEVAYYSPGHDDPIFRGDVVDGFQSFDVRANLGSPPPPSYLWDVLLDVGQVRIHDGGLAEGEADIALPVRNIPLGTDTATLEQRARDNFRADPALLAGVAGEVLDNAEGAADIYYYRAAFHSEASLQGDWLYFVTPADIPYGADGELEREYAYGNPGFYADEDLTEKVSSQRALDGDVEHEKVRIEPGDVLYVEDDAAAVYELTVGDKPSPNRVMIGVERIR